MMFLLQSKQVEAPILQTAECCLCSQVGSKKTKRKKKKSEYVILAVFERPSKFSRRPWVVLSPTWRLGLSEDGTDSAGLTQSSLMGTEEEKSSVQQQHLKIST